MIMSVVSEGNLFVWYMSEAATMCCCNDIEDGRVGRRYVSHVIDPQQVIFGFISSVHLIDITSCHQVPFLFTTHGIIVNALQLVAPMNEVSLALRVYYMHEDMSRFAFVV